VRPEGGSRRQQAGKTGERKLALNESGKFRKLRERVVKIFPATNNGWGGQVKTKKNRPFWGGSVRKRKGGE